MVKKRWDTLIKRQAFIIGEIEHQKKLTPELKAQILSTFKPELLEDLYLPYKIKRKTKAASAKDAGLEALSRLDLELRGTERKPLSPWADIR
jgi:uncharacterized protein